MPPITRMRVMSGPRFVLNLRTAWVCREGKGSAALRVVVCADRACATLERILQVDRAAVLLEKVRERLVGDLLKGLHAVACVEVERHPGGAVECDALADLARRLCGFSAFRHEYLTEECFSRHDTQNQEYQEDHHEDEEEHLGDARSTSRDVGESECSGDQRDEEEEKSPAQHVVLPLHWCEPVRLAAGRGDFDRVAIAHLGLQLRALARCAFPGVVAHALLTAIKQPPLLCCRTNKAQ